MMAPKANYFFPATVIFAVWWIARTHCILITVPKNTFAKIGDRVEFECSTNETISSFSGFSSDYEGEAIPLTWMFSSATSSTADLFIYHSGYVDHNLSSRYSVDDHTPGSYNLIVNSVALSFAGTYTCSGPQILGEDRHNHASAELIIFASDPVCGLNPNGLIMEGDYIRMWCTINYSGNWIPVMKWTRDSERIIDDEVFTFTTSNRVTSSVTIRLESSDDGVTFTCTTGFDPVTAVNGNKRPRILLAVNIPLYQYVWSIKTNVSSIPVPPNLTRNTIALPTCGVIAVIGFVALGLGIWLTLKSCGRVNCRSSDETSIQHQDHKIVIESNIDSGGTEHTDINQSTSHQDDSEYHVAERTTCEDYSSLKRSSSVTPAEPVVYAQLHLYANINSIDNN